MTLAAQTDANSGKAVYSMHTLGISKEEISMPYKFVLVGRRLRTICRLFVFRDDGVIL